MEHIGAVAVTAVRFEYEIILPKYCLGEKKTFLSSLCCESHYLAGQMWPLLVEKTRTIAWRTSLLWVLLTVPPFHVQVSELRVNTKDAE